MQAVTNPQIPVGVACQCGATGRSPHTMDCLSAHEAAIYGRDRPPVVSLYYSGYWRNFQNDDHYSSTVTDPQWHTTEFVELALMCPEITYRVMSAALNQPGKLSPREDAKVREMLSVLRLAAPVSPHPDVRTRPFYHRRNGWAVYIAQHRHDGALHVWEKFDPADGETGELFYAEVSEFDLGMAVPEGTPNE